LNDPRPDQCAGGPGERAAHRRENEYPQAQHEHPARTDQVGQSAAWNEEAAEGQRVRSDHPVQAAGGEAEGFADQAAAAALESIHRLRGIIATTFTELITEPESGERHWTALRPYVVEATTRVELGRSATAYQLTWPDTDDLDAIIWTLAHSAFDLLRSPQLRRLKRCVACPWLFLDGSKNSSRRWCTMNICGTDEKIRRYVSRRAERRKAEH
jgi:predicted RNA-binding Zn ribbon-like protein